MLGANIERDGGTEKQRKGGGGEGYELLVAFTCRQSPVSIRNRQSRWGDTRKKVKIVAT